MKAYQSIGSLFLGVGLLLGVGALQAGTTERVSVDSEGNQANGGSLEPAISADGRYVGFLSEATNLVPDDTNDELDAFVHDRKGKVPRR